jgi:hypothetical protein
MKVATVQSPISDLIAPVYSDVWQCYRRPSNEVCAYMGDPKLRHDPIVIIRSGGHLCP